MLCLSIFTGRVKEVILDQIKTRNNGIRVPAIVFNYHRHSGDIDEGMTYGSSIFAYLVFALGRASIEGIARPMKIAPWYGPGIKLDVQGKHSKSSSWIRIRLGFIQTGSICTLLGGQSRDPAFAYKRLGGMSCSG
jgi:hypothetical protein